MRMASRCSPLAQTASASSYSGLPTPSPSSLKRKPTVWFPKYCEMSCAAISPNAMATKTNPPKNAIIFPKPFLAPLDCPAAVTTGSGEDGATAAGGGLFVDAVEILVACTVKFVTAFFAARAIALVGFESAFVVWTATLVGGTIALVPAAI